MTEERRKWIWIGGLVVFLLFSILVGWYVGVPMVRLAKTPDLFRNWVDSHGIWGRILFVGMVYLQVIVALIPGEPLELAAGYAFGIAEGMCLSMIGILLGSFTVFMLVRWLGVKFVSVFFAEREIRRLSILKDPRKSFLLALLLMTIPGTPKDLLSYFAGLTPLRLSQWLGIVAVGRIPSVLSSVVTGAAAGERTYGLALLIFGLTALISFAGIGLYHKICKDNT
ncbi:MAG: TVP38/TMEM64 family protein [Oscillospiraceae bacterium]|nr:TVP38/TMEM64 family protein [Oscillospiraceae bacterium]